MRYFINQKDGSYIIFRAIGLSTLEQLMEEKALRLGHREVNYLRYLIFRLFRI